MSTRSFRVLIIDGSSERAAILERGLRDAMPLDGDRPAATHHIRDTAQLLPRIAAIDPDAILIGLENASRDTLEPLLEVARLARRPVAMFVDRSDAVMVQAAIDAGVSAYVVDGLRRERVKAILDVAVSRFRAFERLQSELARVKAALDDRKIVERAKAILMSQRELSEEEAYALLRRTAMNQNRKIAEVASSLLTASTLLGRDASDA
jgi:response regulator NasT